MSEQTTFKNTSSDLDVWVFCSDTLGLLGSTAKEPELQL